MYMDVSMRLCIYTYVYSSGSGKRGSLLTKVLWVNSRSRSAKKQRQPTKMALSQGSPARVANMMQHASQWISSIQETVVSSVAKRSRTDMTTEKECMAADAVRPLRPSM